MLNIDDRILTEVSADQFWLMCHIAKFMNEDATCFPSNKTLCEKTGWKVSKLNEVKKACIDARLLKSETRYNNNRQSTNEYTILTDRIYAVVNLKGKRARQIPATDATPCHSGNTPPTADATPPPATLATTEVLTSNEVLTIEREIAREKNEKSDSDKKGPGLGSARPIKSDWGPVEPDAEIEEMLVDDLCKERFFQQCRIPLDQYRPYVENFRLKVKSEQAKHTNRRDFRSHFFSWATLEFARNSKTQSDAKFKFRSNDTITDALEFAEQWRRENELGLFH